MFGTRGAGHVRLNFATGPDILTEAVTPHDNRCQPLNPTRPRRSRFWKGNRAAVPSDDCAAPGRSPSRPLDDDLGIRWVICSTNAIESLDARYGAGPPAGTSPRALRDDNPVGGDQVPGLDRHRTDTMGG